MIRILTMLAVLISPGCTSGGWFHRASGIKLGDTAVSAPDNAGKPATVTQQQGKDTLSIPAGTLVTVTRTDPVKATETAPAIPAVVKTEWKFTAPAAWESFTTHTDASTGTVDTSVAKHQQDLADRRPLLYAALAAALGAVVCIYLQFPSPAVLCGIAAGVFFAAWKLSDLPSWFWAIGIAAIAIGAGLYFGHRHATENPTA